MLMEIFSGDEYANLLHVAGMQMEATLGMGLLWPELRQVHRKVYTQTMLFVLVYL